MIKFLLQTENNRKHIHDFTFILEKSMKYHDWIYETKEDSNPFQLLYSTLPNVSDCVPIGSVDFVMEYLELYHNKVPKPMNVPEELFSHLFTRREIANGDNNDVQSWTGKFFFKSNDKIKGYQNVNDPNNTGLLEVPEGNYQISEIIDVESEWRTFVYQGKLVGLKQYSGDFTVFPDIDKVKEMINTFKSAPIAYTLDVGITNDKNTVVIEAHDFFSCGFYGFNDHSVIPYMFSRWWYNYVNDIKYKKN